MGTFLASDIQKNSDQPLVTAAKRGDTHAFEKLVLRHKQRVFAVALRITKNREDAEDVAQESFHKAFLHLDGFQEKSQFSSWLTRITLNEAFALLRHRRRIPEGLPAISDDNVNPILETFVDQGPNPEEYCWRRERADILTKAIKRLGPTIRRTILLRDIEDRSIKETAEMLETSVSAVKSRVFRGRRELSETMNRALLFT
ncbi:MAG: sigma-70 family RNA polymerase sigma factor [Candidatus Acidiferrales bacterium]